MEKEAVGQEARALKLLTTTVFSTVQLGNGAQRGQTVCLRPHSLAIGGTCLDTRSLPHQSLSSQAARLLAGEVQVAPCSG